MNIPCTASQLCILQAFYLTKFSLLCGGFSIFSYGSHALEMLYFVCISQHQAATLFGGAFASYFLMLWGGSAISQSTTQLTVATDVPVQWRPSKGRDNCAKIKPVMPIVC